MNLPNKYILGLTLIVLLCCSRTVFGQLTGSKHIPGDYATITAAVAALNTSGVGTGGVTFNVAAGYTETISAVISLTASGTSANPIIFQKDPATSGANPLITAYTGGTGTPAIAVQDGIWRLVGSDYVTIYGIDLKDNPSNTTNPSTMEYGYALYKQSTSNGCQFDTIKNCTITLNRINNTAGSGPMVDGSTGIIVMNALATSAVTTMTPVAGGTNSNNAFYSNTIQNCNTGIALIGYAAASPFTLADANNDVGGSSPSTGNTIINYGGAASAANPAAGIRTLAQYGINISYNTINSNNGSGVNHPNVLRGIYNNTATSANATITYNTITVNGTGTTQIITGIENAAGSTAASNTITISNNTITNCTYTTATSGGLYGIYNTATPATLTINSNTFSGNATSATSGVHYAIYNAGAVTTAININSNNIGTSLANAITFNAANSGAQIFINNTTGTATAALSISNNNFQGINYATAGTGANTYISNTAATLSQAINSNTFTNLNVNTTGNITFIANSVIVSATGTQNVNSNSISGTFTKAGAGGTVTLFTSTATCVSGSIINNNNNDFSNITVSGATIIAGWVNTDAGASTKNIQNNNFSNWTAATGTITGINVNITSANNSTSGNTVNNFSGAAAITGIATAAGNDNIYSNTINTLSTTGAVAVTGIAVTAGTTKNIYRNKIYDLQANNASGTVNGITVSGTTGAVTTANIYNNIIGDLRTPGASAADPVRGIAVTSTKANSNINVYYNTIYLNASSTGTNFGTTGIYHTASATATTATLDLRNNIIVNTSTTNGTGLTVAYRRSSTSLGNYATTSNNNLFFSGVPGTARLLFYDGTNSDQLLTTFKTRVSTRESSSVTEDLISGARFLSTSGASPSFLHLDPTRATLAESGGANITNFTDDVDAETRQGNPGYAGTGTAPDIGADEFEGTSNTGLAGSYMVGTGQTYPSLTGAGGLFAALNTYGLSNNVTVTIMSDLAEDGSYPLYQSIEQGAGNYTLTINPDVTATRLISGNVVGGLIRFNGADRVNIDGGSGKYLTFRNTNTAGTTGTAFTFINGASNNTIQNCTIEAYANATNGVILFSTSTVVGGNSNNQISNCAVNATVNSNTGNLCIYSAGTTGNENSSNLVSNNTIYNYRDRALDITATGSTAWAISGNSFYNGDVAALINYASASTLHGIRILGGSGYSIVNNYIGGNAALASGTNAGYSSTLGNISYQGIVITTNSATPASYIKGNTIAGITISSVPTAANSNSFIGIESNGSGINIGGSSAGEGNTIGSATYNSSIVVTTTTATATFTSVIRGINCLSTGGLVTGNQVGCIDIKNIGTNPAPSTFQGIYVNNATAPAQINNNIIGGSATNSIQVLAVSTATKTSLTGIALGASITSTVQVDGNTIQNMSHLSTVTTVSAGGLIGISTAAIGAAAISLTNNTVSSFNFPNYSTGLFYGIYNSGTATTTTISGNTINSLSTISGAAVTALSAVSGTTNTIAKNKIYDLQANNAAGTVNGILISGTTLTTVTIYNNIIGDLRTPSTSSTTDAIRAISLLSTTANSTINVYYNTIYLNAGSTGTNFSSTGIYHTASGTATTAALNLRNNSITNMSTPKGTGLTVAYRRSTTALNNYATTSNNNLFYAGTPATNKLIFYNGTNSDQTLTTFKTRVSTRETQSVTEDLSAKFLNTSGSSASFLHMNTTIATLVESNAVNIAGFTDDVDSDTRQSNSGYAGTGTAPDIGADEFEGIEDKSTTWTGTSSNDWNTATNWLSGSIPDATSNVVLPGSLAIYPLLSTGTYATNDITLQSGSTLTVNGATLQIGGAINNSGTFTVSNGTIEMNGASAQTIPSGAFAGSTIPNLTITNSAGVTVGGTLNISGTLKANSGTLNTGGFVTLLSTATQTAQIDGSGAGDIAGNLTMQRYLTSAFGYKYLSSPFQAATVNELADDIDLAVSFPTLYKFDESLTSTGYVNYTNTSGILTPLQGYAANFGSLATPKTVTISGVVNNGPVSLGTLYNHNNEFTQGYNLLGNPYPSPVDWNAGSGWTRTNIDNALYYFNAGSTDQYTGTYSSYINGVSSDGVASNVIPSMQGFFVHVSDGTYPVSASISINNNARVKNLTVVFQAAPTFRQPPPLLRIDAGFTDDKMPSDPLVVYFNDAATSAFDKNYDAFKLMNTNAGVPNFYSIASDASKLSVAALRYQGDKVTSIPLGLSIKQSGWISFNVRDLENMPDSLHIYLADAVTGNRQDLRSSTPYRVYLQPGKYENRFSLVFSAKEIVNNPEEQSLFNAYNSQGKLYVAINTDKADIMVSNTMGQVLYRQTISGKGVHELNIPSGSGIYIISLISNKNIQSRKIFIGN